MAKIFISYRREDSQHQADRLHKALAPYVDDPQTDIFIDVDNIPFGINFTQHLNSKVKECDVLLALIGPGWLQSSNPSESTRRLDDPNDFVRIEIAVALQRGIPVVPVLLDGTPVPSASQLPDDLKSLAEMNGVPVQRRTFDADVGELVNGLPGELRTKLKKNGGKSIGAPPSKTRTGAIGSVLVAMVVVAISAGAFYLFDHLELQAEPNSSISQNSETRDQTATYVGGNVQPASSAQRLETPSSADLDTIRAAQPEWEDVSSETGYFDSACDYRAKIIDLAAGRVEHSPTSIEAQVLRFNMGRDRPVIMHDTRHLLVMLGGGIDGYPMTVSSVERRC